MSTVKTLLHPLDLDRHQFKTPVSRQTDVVGVLVGRMPCPLLLLAPNKASLAFILWPSDQEHDCGEVKENQFNNPDATARKQAEDAIKHRTRRIRVRMCIVEGCTKRAKFHQKCWGHGGSVGCTIPDCTNRAKTKGLCWSHGGGKLCSTSKCRTIAVSNGVCWAHGGGKRCLFPNCARPAYGNIDNLCKMHYQQHQS